MTKDEALRLALEALEKLWNIIDDIDTYSDMAKADEKLYRSLVERRQRQRFEETGISTDGYELHGGAITAIKAALEAKDEPVAWQVMVEDEALKEFPIKDMAYDWCVHKKLSGSHYSYWIRPLYTTPPQRTWVGLTDEEKKSFWTADQMTQAEWDALFNAIEAKLKEKNT